MINEATVNFFGQPVTVRCDRCCEKAWGITTRLHVYLSNDDADYVYLADGELGKAPVDPGTYFSGDGKPVTPDDFPNQWCIRECERCSRGEKPLPDFSQRRYNIPSRHPVTV